MDKCINIKLPYGEKDYQTASIPLKNYLGYYCIKENILLKNLNSKIKEVISKPISSPSLYRLVKGKNNILIICDDNTRKTPVKFILSVLLEFLNSIGIRDSNIKILFALGTHRPMTNEEIKKKIGEDVFYRIKPYNHDCRKNLIFRGKTSLGIPIYINKLVYDADFIMGIGNIIPHRYCGWAGGGKIILPGICGEETIIKMHSLVMKDSSIKLGNLNNSAYKEINEVAKIVGLKFIINTILNGNNEIVDVVAGNVEETHRRGIKIAEDTLKVPIPTSDAVVISSYPEDLNLWQALKALYTADCIIKEGGFIILVSPLFEGIGEHREFIELLKYRSIEIEKKIQNNEIQDLLSGIAAFTESMVIEKNKVLIVTGGISDKVAEKMEFKIFGSLQEAINNIIAKKPNLKISCIKEGINILPITVDGIKESISA